MPLLALLRSAGFWLVVSGIAFAGYGAFVAGSARPLTTTEAVLIAAISGALTTFGGIYIGRTGTIAAIHARSLGRSLRSSSSAVREGRNLLGQVQLPSDTSSDVKVVLAQAESALAVAESSLNNMLEDLLDIQPAAFETPVTRGPLP